MLRAWLARRCIPFIVALQELQRKNGSLNKHQMLIFNGHVLTLDIFAKWLEINHLLLTTKSGTAIYVLEKIVSV